MLDVGDGTRAPSTHYRIENEEKPMTMARAPKKIEDVTVSDSFIFLEAAIRNQRQIIGIVRLQE